MAPFGLLQRLRDYWRFGRQQEAPPPLSTRSAVAISILFTISYVAPFYLFSTTRPSNTISRDSPSVIKARIRSVYTSCLVCTLLTIYVFTTQAHLPYWETFRLLGWYPVSAAAIGKALLLTSILFLGPLFEYLAVEEGWRGLFHFRSVFHELSSWAGWRNYVAGPISEELLFRSLLVPINLLSPQVIVKGLQGNHAKNVILSTPLFFGVAHIHHLYEFRITHPHVPWRFAIARALLQLTYTTLFGWYAAFVFVRTGSVWAVILIHSLCNCMGLPRLWGRVERPSRDTDAPVVMKPLGGEPTQQDAVGFRPRSGSYVRSREKPSLMTSQHRHIISSNLWTVTYYVLLLLGSVGFWKGLWPLTSSPNQLASI